MKRIENYVMILLAGLSLSIAGCSSRSAESHVVASNNDEANYDDSEMAKDNDFVNKAADAGMLEVQLGQLAQDKANSEEVKNFGNQMITDHSKANMELRDIGSAESINVPSTLTQDSQDKYDKLAKMQGAEFDKAYIDMQVKDHKKVIDLFQKEAQNGDNDRLQSWAQDKVPTLQHHLDMAQNIQQDIQNNNSTM